MEINAIMIEKLAALSRLEFNAEEKEELQQEMQKMLDFVSQLSQLDTESVKPLLHLTQANNVFREDIAESNFSSSEALSNAKNKDERFFKVPKVISK
jgi:aspartyl-tRNA(Asn)/glutamyl-tRNA(Gln) amidotransferase subunit C